MSRLRKVGALIKKKPLFSALIAAAVVMILFSGVQTGRAALVIVSNDYLAGMETDDQMAVTVLENGSPVSTESSGADGMENTNTAKLLDYFVPEGSGAEDEEVFHPGQEYTEELCVKNTGEMEEYVRVVLYKYWKDKDQKRTDLNPGFIILGLENTESGKENGWCLDKKMLEKNGWLLDEKAGTTERIVLYYKYPLKKDEVTGLFADKIRVDHKIVNEVTPVEKEGGSGKKAGEVETMTFVFTYEDKEFALEAEADGIQTHNADEAIKSAWGANVAVSKEDGTTLELLQQ